MPPEGFEPATLTLRESCSTAELQGPQVLPACVFVPVRLWPALAVFTVVTRAKGADAGTAH
jgi:hypothetical protein